MTVAEFYDQMAPYYHMLFHGDFDESISYHGWSIDVIIRRTWGDSVQSVLDLSCGIGTQALGLAQRGYRVTASDISAAAVARARREAVARGIPVDFSVADMRDAYEHHDRTFDLVIAVENAVPHLLSDEEILRAFKQFFLCCRPGGGCLISVRDYDKEDPISPQIRPYPLKIEGKSKFMLFQVWEFDGPIYDVSLYVVKDDGISSPQTKVMRTKYYAVGVGRLMDLLSQAGFSRVARIDDLYFQPTVVGTRPTG